MSVMEYPVMDVDSVTAGIKRRVKDRITKTKLNVSLASKIKTKILNNSSIFKISLKHNNRALARALSREKENSRRITTEKMLLQKEVEKLNFENTFLRLKLNNLNKKLIEIESLVNNHLITAIEMSSLSEFHQSSLLLSAGGRKKISKQCKSVHLPFARVPLTSENDDDDGDDDKRKTKYNNRITSKTPPDTTSSVSRQSLSLQQYNLEVLLPKEDNQNTCGAGHSEHTSHTDVFPKESHYDSDQSPKSSLSEPKMNTALSTNLQREKLSLNNVTERRKRGSSADNLYVTDLDHQQIPSPGFTWNNEISDCPSGSREMQRNTQCFPNLPSESASHPTAQHMETVQNTDGPQLQKTVYENTDMDLTASEVSKIITVSKSNKSQSKKKTDCGKETFRKVKDTSSEKKRQRSNRRCKSSSEMGAEEETKDGPERGSVALDGRGDSEDPDYIPNTGELPQANMLKKIIFQSSLDQEKRQNKKRKQTHKAGKQKETHPSSQCSVKLLQDSTFDQCPNTLPGNINKPSRQTFVIHRSVKDNLFPNQKDGETSSENLEVTNEFHVADLPTKDSENVCDYETQTMLDLKKYVKAQELQSKINKPKQKINRRTKIISSMNQIYEDNDNNIHVEKDNFPLQTQANKETTYGGLEASKEFEAAPLYTRNNGNLSKTQNILDLHKQFTSMHPAENESQISKIPRRKVSRKTEVLSGESHLSNDRGVYCSEKDKSFPLQKDKDISGTFKDLREFEMPAFCDKDSAKLCDSKNEMLLGLSKHDHNMQPACNGDSKVDKKRRQKVCRKTEIISKPDQIPEHVGGSVHEPLNKKLCLEGSTSETVPQMNQTYENINEDLNGFQSSAKDEEVMSCYYGEINSNKDQHCDPVPDPCILVKKQRKKISSRENLLAGDKNTCILQLPDSSQQSVALGSGLHRDTKGTDSGPGELTDLPKSQKQNAVSAQGEAVPVGTVKGENCPARRVTKLLSKSKKRKTCLDLPPDAHGAVQITASTDHTKSVCSQQTDKENYLENEEIAKSKPHVCTKVLKPLSLIQSSNIKNSLDNMCESSVPLSISSRKSLMIEENSSLESACVFPVGDDVHGKMKERAHKSCRRTQKSGTDKGTFQDLVDNSSVSSNTTKPEDESGGQSAEPVRRRRRCTPLSLREPNLVSKMRR